VFCIAYTLQEITAAIGPKEKRQDLVDRELFGRDDEYKHEKLRRMEQSNDLKAAKVKAEWLRAITESEGSIKTHNLELSWRECMREAKHAERTLDDHDDDDRNDGSL